MAPSSRAPETGSLVGDGRFMLHELLGEGGVARVFAADDRELGRRVALKLLHERYHGRPEREQRLLDEAAFLQRIGPHPHVVEWVGSGRLTDCGGWAYVATALLAGQTLTQHKLAVRSIPVQRVSSLARQIAEAIRACHRAGVVHRDVTPGNLMLLGDPRDQAARIVLFDFSHAGWSEGPRVPVGHPDRLTREHEVPGTARYMGPEQVRVDPASPGMDVYAFGVVLWELITGENPFGQVGDRQEFIDLQRRGALEVPRLMAWTYAIPESLAAIVNACLAPEPAGRPSMNAIVQGLDELLGMLDVPSPVESTSIVTRAAEPVSVTLPIPVEAIARAQRRSAGEVDDESEPTERRVVRLPAGPAFARASAAGFTPPIIALEPESEPEPANSPSPTSTRPTSSRAGLLALVGVVLVGLAGLGVAIGLASMSGERAEPGGPAKDVAPVKPQPAPTELDIEPVEPEPVEPEPVEPIGPELEPEPVEPEPVEPEPVEPEPTTPSHQTPECAKIRADANAAIAANEWLEAEALARKTKCWASATQRLRIRVHALAQAERYDECVRVGEGQADQEIKRWVNFCQKQP